MKRLILICAIWVLAMPAFAFETIDAAAFRAWKLNNIALAQVEAGDVKGARETNAPLMPGFCGE